MADADGLYANDPARRLEAARALHGRAPKKALAAHGRLAGRLARLLQRVAALRHHEAPSWRDPLHPWVERPLTIGEPHEGFLYPDPIGFWDEVRRWAVELFRLHQPAWSTSESLSLTTPRARRRRPRAARVRAQRLCQPRMIVFLDEPAWQSAAIDVATTPFRCRTPTAPARSTRAGGARPRRAPSSASRRSTPRCTACTAPRTSPRGCEPPRARVTSRD